MQTFRVQIKINKIIRKNNQLIKLKMDLRKLLKHNKNKLCQLV